MTLTTQDGAHLSDQAIERFRARRMAPRELVAADRHLAGCSECRQRVGSQGIAAAALLSDLAPSDTSAHLSYEDMEAVVDGRATAAVQMAVRTHTATCAACAADLASLQAFAGELAAAPQKVEVAKRKPQQRPFWMTAVAAAIIVVAVVVATRSMGGHDDIQGHIATPGDHTPIAPAMATVLTGAGVLSVDSAGVVHGVEHLPAPYGAAIAAALDHVAPLGAVRPVPPDAAAPPPPPVATYESARATDPTNHLLLGALAEQEHRWADAAREYGALTPLNPTSTIVAALVARVEGERHANAELPHV